MLNEVNEHVTSPDLQDIKTPTKSPIRKKVPIQPNIGQIIPQIKRVNPNSVLRDKSKPKSMNLAIRKNSSFRP
jgi:hypothetical protein